MIMRIINHKPKIWFLFRNENYIIKIHKQKVDIYENNNLIFTLKEANIKSGFFLNSTMCILINTLGKILFVDLFERSVYHKYTHIIDNQCLRVNDNSLFYGRRVKNINKFVLYDINAKKETILFTNNCNVLSYDESDDKISVFGVSKNIIHLYVIDKITSNIEHMLPFNSDDLVHHVDWMPVAHNFSSNMQVGVYTGVRLLNAENIVFVKNQVIDDIRLLENQKGLLDMFWFDNGKYFLIATINSIKIIDSVTNKTIFEERGNVLNVYHRYNLSSVFISFVEKSYEIIF